MSPVPWWERYAGRLQDEIDRLEATGISVTLDEHYRDAFGIIRLELDIPDGFANTENLQLEAVFPDGYPYVAPKVFAHGLEMEHHLNPFTGEVCLLATPGENWHPYDTLAKLLTDQLPEALRAGKAKDRGPWNESAQAEPYSAYYTKYSPNYMILIDGAWSIPGEVRFGALRALLPQSGSPAEGTVGAITKLSTDDGQVLATLSGKVQQFVRGGLELRGRWSRLDKQVPFDDPEAIWNAAESADAQHTIKQKLGESRVEIRAVVYPDEVRQREKSDGWLFLMKVRAGAAATTRSRSGDPRRRVPSTLSDEYRLVRIGHAGRSDLSARAPELATLADGRVIVIGAGAIGSSVILHLARAGVGAITIVDPDVLEPGNIVRHATTFRSIGMNKAEAIAQLAASVSPHTDVRSISGSVGAVRLNGTPESLAQLFAGYSLVIDATAELAIHRLVSASARDANISYLFLDATNGAWGGMVGIVEADSPPCYVCFEHYLDDGTIVLPPASPAAPTQPIGCAQPTFTGAAFDLDEVSLHAARTAVASLSRGSEQGYPRDAYNFAVLELRTSAGERIVPKWTGFTLERHPHCANH